MCKRQRRLAARKILPRKFWRTSLKSESHPSHNSALCAQTPPHPDGPGFETSLPRSTKTTPLFPCRLLLSLIHLAGLEVIDVPNPDELVEGVVDALDSRRGVLLTSSYEFPGRYARWTLGFVDPPLEVTGKGREFKVRALNER